MIFMHFLCPFPRGGGINSDVLWALRGQDEQFHFWFMRWLRSAVGRGQNYSKSGENQTSAVKGARCAISEFFQGKSTALINSRTIALFEECTVKNAKRSRSRRCPWVNSAAQIQSVLMVSFLLGSVISLDGVRLCQKSRSTDHNGHLWRSHNLASRGDESICIMFLIRVLIFV